MTEQVPGPRSAGTAVYYLLILTAVYCFAFVDRQIVTMLVGPIKATFGASDLQIGYVIGPAFIFSAMAVGLPAGLGVDRFNRRNLVIGAGVLWSASTAAAAFVDSYTALLISRALVGGSEAVIFPAGMSLIADLFDRRRLPTANSVFLTSPYVGGGIALIAGGLVLGATEAVAWIHIPLLGDIRGWQTTFLYVGIAGFLPVLLLFTIREPAREKAAIGQARFSVGGGLKFMLVRWRFYAFFYLGMGTAGLVMAMVAAWTPTYLARSFGMESSAIGLTYGPSVLVAGLLGALTGPVVNHWVSRRYHEPTMWTACLGPALIVAFMTLLHFAESKGVTIVCLALLTFSYSLPLSVAGTSLQIMTPPSLRGTSSAVYLIFNSILGYALGPTMVPIVTKYVLHDPARIGDAMKIVGLVCGAIALTSLILAARGYRAERAQTRS
ncbi:MAG: transporter [Sphingomonas bacterium]|uniref:MFS transporter n=1 Tax=Sphingomonas bacterium TaxID=1895847 RepID=UPI002618BF6E|nr:MFS transporter [Sphingomonas bacterium]MDB5704750.1 transporter [Sphingomonas bacterium]